MNDICLLFPPISTLHLYVVISDEGSGKIHHCVMIHRLILVHANVQNYNKAKDKIKFVGGAPTNACFRLFSYFFVACR